MLWGAAAVSAATFGLLYAMVGLRAHPAGPRRDMVRVSTLSPHEYQLYAESHGSAYARWLGPALLMLADRLRVKAIPLTDDELLQAGIDPRQISALEITVLKGLAALAAGALCLAAGVAAPLFFLLAPAAAWLGFIIPNVVLQSRRRARRRQIEREIPDFVGLLKAFVNANVSLEQALHLISSQLVRDTADRHLLARELRTALSRYGLGLTIEEALQALAERLAVDDLSLLVSAITQGKRLGTGMDQLLRDQELLVRMNQRNRATAEASRVSTKLMGVLVAVYLPQFVILVMIPLFWGIIRRAFG